ncbi:hypothetical protein D3C73_378840 [compost metagenome]
MREDLVLIQGNQAPQAERGDLAQQDGVGWAVAFKHFEWGNVLDLFRLFTLCGKLFLNHVQRFTERQRFRLCEEVRQQFGVVVAQWIMADGRSDKVARHQLGPLMDQLIERMLAVGAWFTPDNRAGLVIYRVAVTVNVFAVRLHVALLEISGKTMHILVVRQDRFGFCAEEIVVPDADQRQQHRQVLLGRRLGKVFVHLMRTAQQLLEVFKAQRQRDRQADCRPQRVTATHPVPEFEHIVGVDTKLGHRFTVGRQRSEVFRDVLLIASGAQEPVARAEGVGHGFLSREGFRRHQEQRSRRIQRF